MKQVRDVEWRTADRNDADSRRLSWRKNEDKSLITDRENVRSISDFLYEWRIRECTKLRGCGEHHSHWWPYSRMKTILQDMRRLNLLSSRLSLLCMFNDSMLKTYKHVNWQKYRCVIWYFYRNCRYEAGRWFFYRWDEMKWQKVIRMG